MILLNNTDLLGPEWRFLEPVWSGPPVHWAFFHGVPQSGLEHAIRRPNLARYRAARATAKAARAAGEPAIIVSHLPSMAAPTNFFRRRLCPDVPQIAFAFNFTKLPEGFRRQVLTRMLRGIEEFVVFSNAERQIYSDYFGLNPSRLHFLPWAMERPVPASSPPVSTSTDYVCAIGGEGRDYALFAEAMAELPKLRGVVVARPYSIEGVRFPDNVEIFTNLPLDQTWAIASRSLGLVVPLKTERTACGHVTIVGAQHLGVPLVVTRSIAVADYVSEETARLVQAGNRVELVEALIELVEDRDTVIGRRDLARSVAAEKNRPEVWVRYLAEAARRLVAPGQLHD